MARRSIGHNSVNLSRAEEGHKFERLWRQRIYEKFKTWKSVTMRLGNGDLLTSKNLNQKAKGPDLIIDVDVKNDAAGRRMANKIIKTLKETKTARDDV